MTVQKYVMVALTLLLLQACASHRKGAVCSEIRMRLNSMDYTAEQRVFIQEELDSCLSQQKTLQQQEKQQYRGIYEQFAADSLTSAPTVTDTAEVLPANP